MQAGQPMTVAVVGGAGSMGRWAIRALVKLGSADRVLVADIDIARAQQVANEVGRPCEAIRLDATDPRALHDVFATCDVVLNTMGPFSLFAGPIMDAAIQCRCDYLDIDDDWESTLEAFTHDDRARERGCRVIKGLGGSPGSSNLCAIFAARRLDSVAEIITGWSLGGAVLEEELDYPPAASAAAAVEHWLIQCSGTIRAWRDGKISEVPPLQAVDLNYPGIGPVRTYTVGHPEAVTLPRYLKGVTRSLNVMSGPEWLFENVRAVAADYDAGRITLAEGALRLENPPRPAARAPRDPLPVMWALARGQRAGQAWAVSAQPRLSPPGKMGGNTGVPLAIGLELLRRGSIDRPGVHAPEGVIDPDEFFDLMLDLVEPRASSIEELLEIRELEDLSPTP
jgi:saccharopine dehydrogenase-like NADP-dependent oxidoreductase